MGLLSGCKIFLLYLGALIGPPFGQDQLELQQPLQASELRLSIPRYDYPFPNFPPPNGDPSDPDNFTCSYPTMEGWTDCSTNSTRACWLRASDGREYNISTNYELFAPKGILREYTLVVGEQTINADGVPNPDGKVFNNTYPGPWIQACWGDTIQITVINKLQYNGTTIHWHGLRQHGTLEMDGVNGVTQCPIAPNDSFTYTFEAKQYGTSWYHSHYSLQYADGLLGPMTIYGPSSANWDEARTPMLVTDWSHRSAFRDFYKETTGNPTFPKMNSVLINGQGNFAGAAPGGVKTKFTVEQGKRYLFRIINTSVDTTFIFSIDNHEFEVLTTDFVPIHPYNVTHIAIGIGQRYHIVLNAVPKDRNNTQPLDDHGNYWIRTIPADGCKGFETGNEPDERQGILRYNKSSEFLPTTFRGNFTLECRDENYDLMVPILPWNITPPAKDRISPDDEYDVGLQKQPGKPLPGDNFTRWSIGEDPMWLNFADPTIINLHNTSWSKDYVVVTRPKDFKEDQWVFLAITAPPRNILPNKRKFVPVAHPIHLHGHDFAVLAQSNTTYNPRTANLTFNNPPRRDVVLLPAGGYVVIAFKADNPGVWLLHCHIAWHASNGLALQILERQNDINMTESRLAETTRVCKKWNEWYGDEKNLWDKNHATFQDDSGI